MPLPARLAVAAASGLAVASGFPPYGWWPLLLAGLVGLVVSLRGASPRTAAASGFGFGWVFMVALMPWLRVIGSDAWLGLAAVEGLFYALFGLAFALTTRGRWWPVAATCCWVAAEHLRSTVPFHGFPWGRLAFATTNTPLADYARWVGVPALSGIVFALGCLLVLAWERRGRWHVALGAVGAAVAVAAGSLLVPTGVGAPAGAATVAVIQGDVPGTGANGFGQQEQVLRNHARLTEHYAAAVRAGRQAPADLVLWPENSSDIDPFHVPGARQLIDRAVQDVGVPTLVGSILDGPRAGTALNVGIVWDPVTGPGAEYVKRRLVPFGEYIPFRSMLATWFTRLDQIPRDMLPGQRPGLLQVGPALVGDMLCFDVAYDDVVRDVARGGAQLLVVQTNNATYLGTGQPEQQWAISRLRAIETGKEVVVASTDGISGVVGAGGQVVSRSRSGQAQVLVTSVQLGNGVTLGVRVGGWLEYALTMVAAGLLLAAAVRRVRRRRGGSASSAVEETDAASVVGDERPSDSLVGGPR